MQPYVSIICQDEGHAVALEYAKLVSEAQIPVLVNFPNAEGYPVASSPNQFLGPHTAALIVILTHDVFTTHAKSYPKFKIDLEVIRGLLEASTTPKTFELITSSIQIASHVVQRMKYLLVCPRPAQYSDLIQPMIQTPEHFAFPSGHATQAFAIARILAELIEPGNPASHLSQVLQRQAEMIATNRVIAGVHFHVDSIGGRVLGNSLAEYLIHRAKGGAGWVPRTLDGSATNGDVCSLLNAELDLSVAIDAAGGKDLLPEYSGNDQSTPTGIGAGAGAATNRTPATAWEWLWSQADAEWR